MKKIILSMLEETSFQQSNGRLPRYLEKIEVLGCRYLIHVGKTLFTPCFTIEINQRGQCPFPSNSNNFPTTWNCQRIIFSICFHHLTNIPKGLAKVLRVYP